MCFLFDLHVVNLSLFPLDIVNFTANYHLLSQTNSFKNTFLLEPLNAYKVKDSGNLLYQKHLNRKVILQEGVFLLRPQAKKVGLL